MKRALIIRHHESETMGDNFREILERHAFEFIHCNIFETAPRYDVFDPPSLDGVDLVMAFGGPMSVNDDLPALHAERRYVSDALALGKPVFGVCLGAQMMATALGGKWSQAAATSLASARFTCRRRALPTPCSARLRPRWCRPCTASVSPFPTERPSWRRPTCSAATAATVA